MRNALNENFIGLAMRRDVLRRIIGLLNDHEP